MTEQKNKPGLIKIFFKLITLGGLIVVLYNFLQNRKNHDGKK